MWSYRLLRDIFRDSKRLKNANTSQHVKFLICMAPNSGITFISKAYTRRLSDKKITESGFLDTFYNSQ